jgi:hypothetical protein
MPRHLTDEMGELLAEKARVCGGGAFEIWEALVDARPPLAADFDRVSAENLALQQRLTVQDQRVDDLKGLLRRAAAFTHDLMNPISLRRDIDAALNPTAEAEPQCLLCLDKKTVPGNIPGGFVKDCPDCCGEEG